MPIYQLNSEISFPPVDDAERGLIAVGGDLSCTRLIKAYENGIFPWYSEGEPILWYSPDPRFVLTHEQFHVSRSLGKVISSGRYRITFDHAFDAVVDACASVFREGQSSTWITKDMKKSYSDLHDLGYAHSVEAWKDEELVGGLYGVSIGGGYFGESMFTYAADASKVAFVALVTQLKMWNITLIDCQIESAHLARFGAKPWARDKYLEVLRDVVGRSTKKGRWKLE